MENKDMLDILHKVQTGDLEPEQALIKMRAQPFEDLGYAKIDLHRELRQGVPEVIFGQNKTPEQIIGIVGAMVNRGIGDIIITRMNPDAANIVAKEIEMEYFEIARLGIANRSEKKLVGSVVVASGGTSDMPACEEAALTAEALGNHVTRLYDVGVAGLNRLLGKLDVLMQARVIIVVAGMEGALASVVGGLVSCPVIAVPTSVGYGASLGGLSALLSMLNSCASGVAVVNIDNGFGAGYMANLINKMEGIGK